MPEIVVTAESRTETGKNANRRLRVTGADPRRALRRPRRPVPVSVSPKEIGTILKSAAGREHAVRPGPRRAARRKVILKEFQLEPIKGELLHADFYEVALDKLIQVKVHVELVGVPVGVKVQGGIARLRHPRARGRVPAPDIPEKITVDVRTSSSASTCAWPTSSAGQGQDPDRARRRGRARRRAAGRGSRGRGRRRPAAEGAAAEPEVIKKGKAEAEGEAARSKDGEAREEGREEGEEVADEQASGAPCASWWVWATRASATAGPATTSASWWWTRSPPRAGVTRWRRRAPTPGWRRRRWAASRRCLVKPLTFMNRSGVAVARLLEASGGLPPTSSWSWTTWPSSSGTLRVRERGSHGGHNGLRSLIDVLGTDEFVPRAGRASARASSRQDLADFVLAEFPQEDVLVVQEVVGWAADAVDCLRARDGAPRGR